jgi:hypothetical protein
MDGWASEGVSWIGPELYPERGWVDNYEPSLTEVGEERRRQSLLGG